MIEYIVASIILVIFSFIEYKLLILPPILADTYVVSSLAYFILYRFGNITVEEIFVLAGAVVLSLATIVFVQRTPFIDASDIAVFFATTILTPIVYGLPLTLIAYLVSIIEYVTIYYKETEPVPLPVVRAKKRFVGEILSGKIREIPVAVDGKLIPLKYLKNRRLLYEYLSKLPSTETIYTIPAHPFLLYFTVIYVFIIIFSNILVWWG